MRRCGGGNWFETVGGSVIRGSILGQGDLDIWKILKTVKDYGYNSDISLEFEGMDNWFETVGGSVIRGSILGQGDLDIWKILKTVKDYGYNSDISLEFEGMEECCFATETGLHTARVIWDKV